METLQEYYAMLKKSVVSEKSDMQSMLVSDEPLSQKTRKRVEAALRAIEELEANENPTQKEINKANRLIFNARSAATLGFFKLLKEMRERMEGGRAKCHKKSHKLKEIKIKYKKFSKYYK